MFHGAFKSRLNWRQSLPVTGALTLTATDLLNGADNSAHSLHLRERGKSVDMFPCASPRWITARAAFLLPLYVFIFILSLIILGGNNRRALSGNQPGGRKTTRPKTEDSAFASWPVCIKKEEEEKEQNGLSSCVITFISFWVSPLWLCVWWGF